MPYLQAYEELGNIQEQIGQECPRDKAHQGSLSRRCFGLFMHQQLLFGSMICPEQAQVVSDCLNEGKSDCHNLFENFSVTCVRPGFQRLEKFQRAEKPMIEKLNQKCGSKINALYEHMQRRQDTENDEQLMRLGDEITICRGSLVCPAKANAYAQCRSKVGPPTGDVETDRCIIEGLDLHECLLEDSVRLLKALEVPQFK